VSLGETSSFLEGFLSEAVDFWGASQPDSLDSGAWIEKSASGMEIPLQATALRLENRPILAIYSPGSQYQERVQILQTARSSALEHEMLLREIQKKEILLHCIIHDLSQPLSVMSVALDCVSGEAISPHTAGFIELGRRASDQQQSMIREVLQAFSADLRATLDTETSANNSPDLFHIARRVAESQSPPFAAKNVRIKLALPAAPEQCPITGEESRLQRVFANLLENALRYSPPGSCVTLGAQIDDGFCKAYVDDQGPGLPRDLTPAQIFGLFSKGKQSTGKAGLGLYLLSGCIPVRGYRGGAEMSRRIYSPLSLKAVSWPDESTLWACTSAVLPSSAGVVPSVVSPCRRRVRASGSVFSWLLCKISPHAVSVPGNGKFQRLPPARLPSQGTRCAFFLLTITKTFES
jgi:hypothetical protein